MREVVRVEKGGRFWIAPDITDEEMRNVFPALVQALAIATSAMKAQHLSFEWPEEKKEEGR